MNARNRTRHGWMVLLVALSIGAMVYGQNTPSAKKTPETLPSGSTVGAAVGAAVVGRVDTKDAAASKPAPVMPVPAKPGGPVSEHVVYVPYNKLGDVFEKDASQVVLPFADYQKLRDALRQWSATLFPSTPVNAVITQVAYSGAVEGEVATLTAVLSIQVLREGWVKVPVSFAGAAVAKVEGATVAAGAPGQYQLLLRQPGVHQVTVQLSTAATRSPQGRQVALRGPLAGSTSLDLTLPEEGITVEVLPKLASTRITSSQGKTRVEAVLGATDELTVSWRPRSETVVAQAVLNANNRTLVSIGDGVVHTRAQLDLQVLRGQVSEVKIALPADERLLDVRTPGLRDWMPNVQGQRQEIAVRLLAPVRDVVKLTVETERAIPNSTFTVASIRPLGVERETGMLAVASGDEWNVRVALREGITRVAANEVPSDLQRPSAFYYKFYNPNYQLALDAEPVAARVSVVNRLFFRLEPGRLHGTARLRYDIQRAGLFTLRLRLPAGVEVEGISGAGVTGHEVAASAEGQLVTVQLGRKVLGAFDLQVSLSVARPDTLAMLVPPLVEPLDVQSEQGWIGLIIPEGLEITTLAANTQGVREASPEELGIQGMTLPREPRTTQAAYRYLARPASLAFSVRQRKTRLFADTYTTLRVKEDVTETQTAILYDVQFADTDTFSLQIPEAVAERFEVGAGPTAARATPGGVKEKRLGKPKDGFVPLTVVLPTKILGAYVLTLSYTEPLERAKQAGQAVGQLKLARTEGTEREIGQIAVTKERSLTLTDQSTNLEPIDPRQLTIRPELAAPRTAASQTDETQFAYRYYRQPIALTLGVTKHEIQRVLETIITRAFIDVVVSEEGRITYRATYTIRSSQRDRLPISLPDDTRFVDKIYVAGKGVSPERDTRQPEANAVQYLVNIGRTTAADVPFAMTILYEQADRSRLSPMAFWPLALPKLDLPMPRFTGDATFQRVLWRVRLPKSYTAVGKPTGFTDEIGLTWNAAIFDVGAAPAQHPEVQQWLSQLSADPSRTVFEFPTLGKTYIYGSLVGQPSLRVSYAFKPLMIVVSTLLFLGLMVATLRLPLVHKCSLTMVAVLALMMFSLWDNDSVTRWVSAGVWGIVFGLITWLVQEELQRRRMVAALVEARRLETLKQLNSLPATPVGATAGATSGEASGEASGETGVETSASSSAVPDSGAAPGSGAAPDSGTSNEEVKS